MYLYCYGELDGPFSCKKCGAETWCIFSDHDHENSRAALNDGAAFCETHRPEKIKPRNNSGSIAALIETEKSAAKEG